MKTVKLRETLRATRMNPPPGSSGAADRDDGPSSRGLECLWRPKAEWAPLSKYVRLFRSTKQICSNNQTLCLCVHDSRVFLCHMLMQHVW